MIETVHSAVDQVLALGARYGVDLFVFAAIYIGTIPFCLLSSGIAVRRLRVGRPAAVCIVAAGLCFISAYLYLAVAGNGIPVWVWAVLAMVVAYGAWSAVRSTPRKLGKL